MGLGIPEFEAKQYEDKVRAGNILISVHTEDAEARSRAKDIMETSGAKDISTSSETHAPRH